MSASGRNRETGGLLLGIGAILIWATSAASVVWIGRRVGVWQYLAIGSAIGCLGQIGLYRLLGRSPLSLFVLPPRLWAVAVLGFVFYSICYAMGLIGAASDAQAVGVGLLNHLWPTLTVLFSIFLVPGTRMSARLAAALALSLLGLAIANRHEIAQAGHGGPVWPYLLGGLAGMSWGLYSALIARWRAWGRHYATAPAGFLLVSLAGATGCLLMRQWQPMDGPMWLAFLYLGLVPNAAGYMLWERALHRAPAATLGLLASATPVLSTLCLLGLFALAGKSRTVPAQWLSLLTGAALVAAAALLVSVRPRDRSRERKDPTHV